MLRGFLPAVVVALWSVPSVWLTIGYQWGTPSAAGVAAGQWPRVVFLGYGTLVVAWGPGNASPGQSTLGGFMQDGFTVWRLKRGAFWGRPRFLGTQVFAPLWLIAGVLAVPPAAVLVYRRVTRTGAGCCTRCGYDRAGLGAEAVCPECGLMLKT